MGEPERRRRRLRPPSSANAAAAEAPAADPPAAAPGGPVVTPAPAEIPPVAPTPATYAPSPATPIAETSAVEDPAPAEAQTGTPPETPTETAAQRPARTGFAGRPPRSPGSRPTSGAGAGGDDREAERGLRGLVGSGSSQVSVGAALRARDAARPTDAQLADADQNLTIVRRNWLPREDLPKSR
jgi:hypothetical protein